MGIHGFDVIRNRAFWSPGAMFLAVLVLAALPLRAEVLRTEVFHEPLCESLPEVEPTVEQWAAAPELARVPGPGADRRALRGRATPQNQLLRCAVPPDLGIPTVSRSE